MDRVAGADGFEWAGLWRGKGDEEEGRDAGTWREGKAF